MRRSPGDDPMVDPAFERFALAYSRTLLRSAFLLCGDRGQAEDLLQLTLLRTAGRWQSARVAPEAYARRVLVNLSRDHRRLARRRIAERPLTDADRWPGGRDHTDEVAVRDAVIGALRILPMRQREVLVLRFYLDLSVTEAAAAMGASEGTVKSYTARALARMRELLDDSVSMAKPRTPEVSNDER
jgi:RNA polymerase sigma-70 factor (sigma-E family)